MKLPKIPKSSPQAKVTPRRRLIDDKSPPEVPKATFRRNQTITGSRSSSVRSAQENHGQLQSPRAKTHHLRRRQRSLSGLFLLLMVLIVGLVTLLYQFTAEVSVSVYGQIGSQATTRQAEYTKSIQDYLNQRPLERLRILINHPNLVAYLNATGYDEISEVESVQSTSLGASHISLKVREPVASWVVDGKKQYVDRMGSIFSANYFEEPSVQITDKSGINIDRPQGNVTSSRFLTFVGQAVGMLQESGLTIRQVIIPASGTRQVEFSLSNKDRIKMTIDRPAGEQAEDAARAVRHLVSKNQSVDYIDVRVSGKAYYR